MLDEEQEHEQLLERGIEDERRALPRGRRPRAERRARRAHRRPDRASSARSRDPKLIGFASLVVGIAASMSMAASNFLSVDIGEESELKPGKAAAYTGTAYIFVVVGLVLPFFLLSDRHVALRDQLGERRRSSSRRSRSTRR